jgi:hypothetical protein
MVRSSTKEKTDMTKFFTPEQIATIAQAGIKIINAEWVDNGFDRDWVFHVMRGGKRDFMSQFELNSVRAR